MLKKGFQAEGKDNDDEEVASYDEHDLKALLEMAIDCMNSANRPWLRNYIPALIEAGIYNIRPDKSLFHACKTGCVNVVESLGEHIDWEDSDFKRTMTKGLPEWMRDGIEMQTPFTAAAKTGKTNPETEQCVLKVIEIGIAAGQSDLVFSVTKHENGSVCGRMEPVCSFVDAKFHHALVKFLENGFDPHAKKDGGPSLVEYADKHAPEAAHVIRTFEARRQARTSLQTIDSEHKAGASAFQP